MLYKLSQDLSISSISFVSQNCILWPDDLPCLCPSLRVSRSPNRHQRVPTEASGKWLVQPASRAAEAENNWDCPALPEQAAGAWVLHLALPRGGGGEASPLTPLSCPNTGSQAHTATHTHTHRYPIPTHHLQLCVHTNTHTHTQTQTQTHTHTESLYLYCTVLLFIWIHISTLSAFDSESKVSKTMPRRKKLHFYVAATRWRFEWLKLNSDCLSSFRSMLCGEKRVSACH